MFTGSIKISELNSISSIVGTDFFPLVQSSSMTTFRSDVATLNNWFMVSGSALSASWATASISAIRSISASFASASISASFSNVAISASYAPFTQTVQVSASYASASLSASYAVTSSAAIVALTSSFSVSSSLSSNSISASYALSASYAPTIGDTVPVGTIMAFGSSSAPNNWLECNGDAKSTASYVELYNAITNEHPSSSYGYLCDNFGNRNSSGGFFKIPDFRGEFLRGWDNNRGIDLNRIFSSAQTASVKINPSDATIRTTEWVRTDDAAAPAGTTAASVLLANRNIATGDLLLNGFYFSGTGTETRPRNISAMYCIKYSNAINYAINGATLAGDVQGLTSATSVVAIQGVEVTSSAPIDQDVLTFDSTANKWIPTQLNIANGIKAWGEIMWTNSTTDASVFSILSAYNISNVQYINTKVGISTTFYNYGITFSSALATASYAMIGNGIIFYYDAGDEVPVELAGGFHPIDSRRTVNSCTMSVKIESSALFKSGSNFAPVLTFFIV